MAARAIIIGLTALGCSSAGTSGSTPSAPPPLVPRLVLNTVVTDSQIYRRASLGRFYRYGSGDMRRDVFIYPKSSWPDVQSQARIFIQSLEFDRRRRTLDSYQILTNVPFNLVVRDQTWAAHEVTLEFTERGKRHTSYFAVVSLPDIYAKFRISRPVTFADTTGRGFVEAWTAAYLTMRP